MTNGVLETDQGRWLPEMAAVPADAWVGPERVADLVALIATGRADALSGRFLYALDDIEDLIRRAEDLSGGPVHGPAAEVARRLG